MFSNVGMAILGLLSLDESYRWATEHRCYWAIYVGSCWIQSCQTWHMPGMNTCGQNSCMHCVCLHCFPQRGVWTPYWGVSNVCQVLPPVIKIYIYIIYTIHIIDNILYDINIYIISLITPSYIFFLITPLSGRICWFYVPSQVVLLMKFLQ